MRYILQLIILGMLFTFPVGSLAELDANLEPITPENVSRLAELHVVGRGKFLTGDISPDGRTFAIGTSAGIWLYNLRNLADEPIYLRYSSNYVLEYDETGTYLRAGNKLIHLDQNNQILEVIQHHVNADLQHVIHYEDDPSAEHPIRKFHLPYTDKFSPSSIVEEMPVDLNYTFAIVKEAADGYSGVVKEIRLFNIVTEEYSGSIRINGEEHGTFSKLALSTDETYLFGFITLWQPVPKLALYRWSIRDMATNQSMTYQEGDLIWQSSEDNSIDAVGLQVRGEHALIMTSPRNGYDPTTIVIDIANRTVVAQIDNPNVFIHPVSGDLMTVEESSFSSLIIANYTNNEILGHLNDFGGKVRHISFDANETALLSINQNNTPNWIDVTVHLRDTETWQSSKNLELHDQIDTLVGFQPDGRPIVISAQGFSETSQKRVDIWDLENDEILYSQEFVNKPYISLSRNGGHLFISGDDSRWLYDIQHPETPLSLSLPPNEFPQSKAYFSSDGQYLALVEYDTNNRLLILWSLSESREVARITNRYIVLNQFAEGVQWTSDGRRLALCEVRNPVAGDLDYQITFWELENLETAQSSYPVMTIPNAMLCRFDDISYREFAIPTYELGIQKWSTLLSYSVATYGKNDYAWWRVARFNPDASLLFGIDYAGYLSIWDTLNLENELRFEITPYRVFDEISVDDLQFVNNGELLVMPSADGTIRIWGIPANE